MVFSLGNGSRHMLNHEIEICSVIFILYTLYEWMCALYLNISGNVSLHSLEIEALSVYGHSKNQFVKI